MSTNPDAMVRDGIAAYKAGDKDRARDLFIEATDLDPENEQGWLWLSGLLESDEEKRICLENVLVINPNNAAAKKGLAKLDQKAQAAAPPAEQPADSGQGDWVANLSLANQPTEKAEAAASDFSFESFSDDDFANNSNQVVVEPADDPFAGSPFGDAQETDALSVADDAMAETVVGADLFAEDDDFSSDDFASDDFGSDDFADDDFGGDDFAGSNVFSSSLADDDTFAEDSSPFSNDVFATNIASDIASDFGTEDEAVSPSDDDFFATGFDESGVDSGPFASSGAFSDFDMGDDADDSFDDLATDDAIVDDDIGDDFGDDFSDSPVFGSGSVTADAFGSEYTPPPDDDESIVTIDPRYAKYFDQIPASIPAASKAGGGSIVAMLGLILTLALNAAGVVLIILGLGGS